MLHLHFLCTVSTNVCFILLVILGSLKTNFIQVQVRISLLEHWWVVLPLHTCTPLGLILCLHSSRSLLSHQYTASLCYSHKHLTLYKITACYCYPCKTMAPSKTNRQSKWVNVLFQKVRQTRPDGPQSWNLANLTQNLWLVWWVDFSQQLSTYPAAQSPTPPAEQGRESERERGKTDGLR